MIQTCSGITRAQWRALCTKITGVNLFTFAYRLFHEDFSSKITLKVQYGFQSHLKSTFS